MNLTQSALNLCSELHLLMESLFPVLFKIKSDFHKFKCICKQSDFFSAINNTLGVKFICILKLQFDFRGGLFAGE